jgi:hypothetical protein
MSACIKATNKKTDEAAVNPKECAKYWQKPFCNEDLARSVNNLFTGQVSMRIGDRSHG